MKTNWMLCLLVVFSFLNVQAAMKTISPKTSSPKVIYGIDDRIEVFQSPDPLMKELSRSTAAQILNSDLSYKEGIYTLISGTLMDLGICQSERFSNQKAAAQCSGFLVAEDILVTGGHCIKSLSDCDQHSWVFDFANTTEEKSQFTFTKDQVFHCTQILALEKNSGSLDDYAVLKLDRPVPGRTGLKFRTEGKASNDVELTVLGYPTGLPLKIIPHAEMKYNGNAVFFSTNADTYAGNSGSPVVDSKTGIVEGLIVRGDSDYIPSGDTYDPSCLVSFHNDQRYGNEHATRITNIDVIKKK